MNASNPIVVLDGFTLNPGDLHWDALSALGNCTVHDRTAPSDVVPRAANARVILTNKTALTADHIRQLPALEYIGVLATGFNIVDVDAARARGIPVTNVPAYGTRSVAQMTWALILELALHTGRHAASVATGDWARCPDFSYSVAPLVELDGLTLGIVGFGRIGAAVAAIGAAMGMKVIAHAPRPPADSGGVEFVALDELFQRSDVISLHCPLTPATRELVDERRLNLMKPTAFLVNTSRGPLIRESALASALASGRIAGAALDVLSVEPPTAGNPLIGARNCLVTPHMAWATRSARARLLGTAVQNVRAFLDGRWQNVVNGVAGPGLAG